MTCVRVCASSHVSQAYGQSGTGKTRLIQGTNVDVGLLPRTLSELFALRKSHHLIMSLSFMEVTGSSVRDLLDAACLASAGVDPAHVITTTIDSFPVREVLALHRVKTFGLLDTVLSRRTPSSALEKRHFITYIRIERVREHKVSTLVIADLAGTVEVGTAERDTFKAGVESNSNLVRAQLSQASSQLTLLLLCACSTI
jgi:hypothetical protein